MLIQTYQQEVMRTGAQGPFEYMISVGLFGLVGELGEVIDDAARASFPPTQEQRKKLTEEIGDALWYLFYFANAIEAPMEVEIGEMPSLIMDDGLQLSRAARMDLCNQQITIDLGCIAENLKKGHFHEHGIRFEALYQRFAHLYRELEYLARLFEVNILDAMEGNITKLRLRYPTGFSVEDSKARRDVTNEETTMLPAVSADALSEEDTTATSHHLKAIRLLDGNEPA